jgi:membrane-bound lytic murein transglycosylase B
MLLAPRGTAKNWRATGAALSTGAYPAGVRFWNENAAALARAEQEYGVPQEIIVGIVGVETLYGQHMGNIRVLDALTTLAFDFPSVHPRAAERQAYFAASWSSF